jgi:hypothetical protein
MKMTEDEWDKGFVLAILKDLENALPYEHCGEIYSLGKPLAGR